MSAPGPETRRVHPRRDGASRHARCLTGFALASALAIGPARADRDEAPAKRPVALELLVSAHAGAHAVVEDELNSKSPWPVFGLGLAGYVTSGPVLLGAGIDAVTILLEGDVLLFAAAGGRLPLSGPYVMTFLAHGGVHRISDCLDAVMNEGCNPGARLPFLGVKAGLERILPSRRPIGWWLSLSQDLETRHVPDAARAPTYGGTVVLFSITTRYGGHGRQERP